MINMNPENIPKFIENVFQKMETREHVLPFSQFEFNLNKEFFSITTREINNACKKALIEYYEINPDITPEMIINAFKHMQSYSWGESGIIEQAMDETK